MKKFFALFALFGILSYGVSNVAFAQEEAQAPADTTEQVATASDSNTVAEEVAPVKEEVAPVEEATEEEIVVETPGFHQQLKQKFIEGGPSFMSFVLITLILGLALAIERIIYLNLASTNTTKLLGSVEDALNSGGIDAAKEICRNTKGPVASIFYQGLERYNPSDAGSVENVEKAIVAYGGVQMGKLEKGLSWIGLFIALAPMLGFMGTVIGMIDAFDAIEIAGDISPTLVAGGIKVALITTVSGLVVAMILQVFYNYIVAKIDSIVNEMEDASISMVDLISKFKA
jgi:biopolymer transport protein ExbB